VRRIPLTAPKVDMATNTGIVQAMYPYNRFANVCRTTIIHNPGKKNGLQSLWRVHDKIYSPVYVPF